MLRPEAAPSLTGRSRRAHAPQEITDTSDGCGAKFEAIIVSSAFNGVQLLERQRMVNEVIAEEMKIIHAFSMKTWTPEQYEKKKSG